MSDDNELNEQDLTTHIEKLLNDDSYFNQEVAALSEKNTLIGTPTKKLLDWIKTNPAPGLSPIKSLMLTGILLWLIHAPRDLLLLTEVLKNLALSIDMVFGNFNKEKDQKALTKRLRVTIDEILAIANYLIENEDSLIEEEIFSLGSYSYDGDNFNVTNDIENNKHPMRGRLSEYPIYSMLMNSSQDEDESFLNLQGLTFLAYANLATQATHAFDYFYYNPDTLRIKNAHSSIQQAALFVRQYSIKDVDEASLEALDDLTDLEGFYLDVTERVDDRQGEEREQYRAALSPLLKKWLYSEYRGSKEGGGAARRRRRKSHRRSLGWHDGFIRFGSGLIQESTAQDPEESYGKQEEGFTNDIQVLSSQASVTEEEEYLVAEQREADLDLAENAVEAELFIAEDTSEASTGRLIIGNQIAHIVRANQLLSTNWSQATLWEIAELLKLCHKTLGPKTELKFSSIESKEAAVIALIMLWTGKSLKSVVSGFRWVNGVSPNPVAISYVYKNNPAHCYLRIKSVTASAKIKPNASQLQYLHPRNEFLTLPDLVGLGSYLTEVFPNEVLEQGSTKLFTKKTTTYSTELNKFLKKLPPGHRVNEHKISMYLFHQIASKTSGDVADAVLITGTYHSLAQTLMHYTSPTLSRQKALYIDTVNKILSDVAAEGYSLGATNHLEKPPSYEYLKKGISGLLTMPFVRQQPKNEVIGSYFLPLKASIIHLVATLKEQIKQVPDNTNLEAIQQYHNHFSLYTVLMLGYATGYRAVKDPYLLRDAIDPTTNLAVISDKDGPELYNSRLVWVPETIQKQLERYQKHYQRLLPRLQHLDQQAYNFTSQASMPALFLLNPNLKWEAVRPRTMKPLLQNNLPLPINVNRRYLRTRLRAGGCPAEVVDAFMGHWGRGQEYWGEYSSLSVVDLLETLKPHITAIQEELGFEVLASQYR